MVCFGWNSRTHMGAGALSRGYTGLSVGGYILLASIVCTENLVSSDSLISLVQSKVCVCVYLFGARARMFILRNMYFGNENGRAQNHNNYSRMFESTQHKHILHAHTRTTRKKRGILHTHTR